MNLSARGAEKLHTQKYAPENFQQAINGLDGGRVRGRAIVVPWLADSAADMIK